MSSHFVVLCHLCGGNPSRRIWLLAVTLCQSFQDARYVGAVSGRNFLIFRTHDRKRAIPKLMSRSAWYHHRAAECDRMALATKSAAARDRHINDRDRWREIAAAIDAADEAADQSKAK